MSIETKTQTASDAEWGRALWDWLREKLPQEAVGLELDREELLQFAAKHGRARKVKFDQEIHGFIDAEPGDEIWWWGDAEEKK